MIKNGFSLVEVIVASAVFAVIIFAASQLFLTSQEAAFVSQNQVQASALTQEYLEKVKNLYFDDWNNLIDGHYLIITDPQGDLALQPTQKSEVIDDFNRFLVIETPSTAGLPNPSLKKITANVSWSGWRPGSYSESLTFARYQDNAVWTQTTQNDFDSGEKTLVETTSAAGGEVQLQGGCPQNPQGPWIYQNGFQNGWDIHPSAKKNIKEVDNTLEISSFNGSSTKLRNRSDQCTLGFTRLEFSAYNSASISQSFWVSGQWTKFFEIVLPPQTWTFFSLAYADINDTNETNLDFLFFRQGTFQSGTKFYLKDITLAGGVGGYFTQGTLISSIFDAGQSVVFNRIGFTALVPDQTLIGFQTATADQLAGPWIFTGPNGTGLDDDLYTAVAGQGLRQGTNFNRYFRYKSYLKSLTGEETPILYDVTVNYSL
ncbi:MAG: prepilin-type N-terminal cleavage/methylation domain-containing protein [Candidatus Shapirobacteria bacterium]